MRPKKLNILKGVATFFLLLGAVGWFTPFLGWPFRSRTESPNSEPHGIVLDNSGNIFCGSKFYGRIQKYYPDGRFARGFGTEGGTERGSDFGFHINEENQLCITVSGISKDNKGSVHRLRAYDQQGKLVCTEKYESNKRDYWHDMSNYATDSVGNLYTFKGFLFPRIIKQTPAGTRTIIISTPIWLWFLQAPFPAFAFFFVSMFIIIFLSFKTNAAKLSIRTLDLIVDRWRLPSLRKFIFFLLASLGIAVLLSIIIPIGFKTYPLLVIFGLISFAITSVIIMLLAFIYAIIGTWRCIKVDFKLWKKSFSSSLKKRYEAAGALRSIMDKDPVTQKAGKVVTKIALLCLLVWLVILVLAICAVLYLDRIGVWHDLINKG